MRCSCRYPGGPKDLGRESVGMRKRYGANVEALIAQVGDI